RVEQAPPPELVDQQRAHDEALLRMAGAVVEGANNATESRDEPPVLGSNALQVPALPCKRPERLRAGHIARGKHGDLTFGPKRPESVGQRRTIGRARRADEQPR